MNSMVWFLSRKFRFGCVLFLFLAAPAFGANWKEKVLYNFQGTMARSRPGGLPSTRTAISMAPPLMVARFPFVRTRGAVRSISFLQGRRAGQRRCCMCFRDTLRAMEALRQAV